MISSSNYANTGSLSCCSCIAALTVIIDWHCYRFVYRQTKDLSNELAIKLIDKKRSLCKCKRFL